MWMYHSLIGDKGASRDKVGMLKKALLLGIFSGRAGQYALFRTNPKPGAVLYYDVSGVAISWKKWTGRTSKFLCYISANQTKMLAWCMLEEIDLVWLQAEVEMCCED